MKNYDDREIIEGILNNDSKVLQYVYKYFFPPIEKLILRKGGDTGDAKDIFQDALIVIFRKIIKNELSLTCKLSTFVYSICKNLWAMQKKSEKNYVQNNADELELVHDTDAADTIRLKILEIFDRQFEKLSRDCQKILLMHFQGQKITEIKKVMNYKNIHHTMDRKYRCKASLIRRIINDPEFKELKNEIKKDSHSLPGRDVG